MYFQLFLSKVVKVYFNILINCEFLAHGLFIFICNYKMYFIALLVYYFKLSRVH